LPVEKLKEILPNIYDEFEEVVLRLEAHFKEMQDIEFTIENGVLYFL
jgi:pyruvate,orthophosphate dikinase